MNRINATITAIESEHHITIISFNADSTPLRMMSLEQNLDLHVGAHVVLGFKASHVALAKAPLENISISNRLHVSIEAIDRGALLCALQLRFGESMLEGVITKNSCEAMQLHSGDTIIALVKASELSIVEVLDD